MRMAIVGCGHLGKQWARCLGPDQLVAVFDAKVDRAVALAAQHPGAVVESNAVQCVQRSDLDAVILADSALAPVARAAVEAGKHILIEKPAALSTTDAAEIRSLAQRRRIVAKAGFPHRHHPAIQKCRELVDHGEIGPLFYVRVCLGRPPDADADVFDDYLHLIDLARWFLGDFCSVHGRIGTCFWDMPIDDNGFLLLRTSMDRVAWLHVECSEWIAPIRFEIFGRDGKLEVDGPFNREGALQLRLHSNQDRTTVWKFPDADRCLELEFAHFRECIENALMPNGSLADAVAALRIARQIVHVGPAAEWSSRRAA